MPNYNEPRDICPVELKNMNELEKVNMQEVLEKLYRQQKNKRVIEKFSTTPLLKTKSVNLFIAIAFLTVIIFMIVDMVNPIFNAIPNPVDKKKFSSEKLNEKQSKTLKKGIKTHKKRERNSDRPFFSFLRKQKKSKVSDSLSAKVFDYLRESLNNWWEKKPLQRERVALFPITLLQSVSMPRGGYQLLTYEELKMSMDPIFLMIHFYKIENSLGLYLEKISQLSKELEISDQNAVKQNKKLQKLKEVFQSTKPKNLILLLDKSFNRLSGVIGFGVALRILTLLPLDPVEPSNLFETKGFNDISISNYENFVPKMPISKELTNEVKIQVGNEILVVAKKVTKQSPELTELIQLTELIELTKLKLTDSTGSLEVPNSVKNINEITPSVISKPKKLKLKLIRKKAKLRTLSDLPKIRQKSTTEEIFSVSEVPQTNRPSIRIRIQ